MGEWMSRPGCHEKYCYRCAFCVKYALLAMKQLFQSRQTVHCEVRLLAEAKKRTSSMQYTMTPTDGSTALDDIKDWDSVIIKERQWKRLWSCA
jgi:hypothetical protein